MVLYSMTGYGEHALEVDEVTICITIQTLNSRYLDIDFTMPRSLVRQSASWRKQLTERLIRGRVDVVFDLHLRNNPLPIDIGKKDIKACYKYLHDIAVELGAQTNSLGLALELLITSKKRRPLTPRQYTCIEEAFTKALDECVASRLREGKQLTEQIERCLVMLKQHLDGIIKHIPERKEKMRKRLEEKIQMREGMIDAARWEQEVLYYLEKMDIEEECVRFRSHVDYLSTIIHEDNPLGGRLSLFCKRCCVRSIL